MEHDFSAIERLMEFGIGMGVAQQMIGSMNTTMQSMQTPIAKLPQEPGKEWYVVGADNKPAGPYTEREIKRMLLDKTITKDTLVWSQGMAEWQRASEQPDIIKMITLLPPQL